MKLIQIGKGAIISKMVILTDLIKNNYSKDFEQQMIATSWWCILEVGSTISMIF